MNAVFIILLMFVLPLWFVLGANAINKKHKEELKQLGDL